MSTSCRVVLLFGMLGLPGVLATGCGGCQTQTPGQEEEQDDGGTSSVSGDSSGLWTGSTSKEGDSSSASGSTSGQATSAPPSSGSGVASSSAGTATSAAGESSSSARESSSSAAGASSSASGASSAGQASSSSGESSSGAGESSSGPSESSSSGEAGSSSAEGVSSSSGEGDAGVVCAGVECQGVCCAAGQRCGPKSGACVDTCATAYCGPQDTCCGSGQVCNPSTLTCVSECSPGVPPCGNGCCDPGILCDEVWTSCALTCDPSRLTCGSRCCAPGALCTSGTNTCTDACPAALVCGTTCCAATEECDATLHTCIAICPTGPRCGATQECCAEGSGCHGGACVPELASCVLDSDCQNDSYCDQGTCIAYGGGPRGETDPECLRLVPLGLFSPSIQCEWAGPPATDPFPNHHNVLVTPLVIDFDFDDNPTTLHPSVVFTSYNSTDGGGDACAGATAAYYGVIRILDGNTCQLQFTLSEVHVIGSSTPALADLDGDGRAEVVAQAAGGGIVIYHYNSTTHAWTAKRAVTAASPPVTSTWGAGVCNYAGVAVYDVDGAPDGRPEVLLGGWVYSADGVEMATGRWIAGPGTGQIPVVVDVDLDGQMELVDGARVYKWNATTGWTAAYGTGALPEGYVAVADFGNYAPAPGVVDVGYPELAVVTGGTVTLYSHRGVVLWGPIGLPVPAGAGCGAGIGGPPTIGDFDGDGRAEIAVAGGAAYAVFDPVDCPGPTPPAACYGVGIRWARLSKDCSSNRTGSSIFDFEADGKVEAVYADECYARVYDGTTGAVLFSQPHTSCTWNENVIIADVDGDYRSEMVVPANNNCGVGCSAAAWSPDPAFPGLRCATDLDCPSATGCNAGFCRCTSAAQCPSGGTYACSAPLAGTPGTGNVCRSVNSAAIHGIRIYRDIQDRWANSRPTWNQHAYFVTNVDDNGHVPSAQEAQRNWATPGLNNFRQNVQGGVDPLASPDITARAVIAECVNNTALLRMAVCNRGAAPLASGLPIAFYQGDPRVNGVVVCVANTPVSVNPGDCTSVECAVPAPGGNVLNTWVQADDDGTGSGDAAECEEGNNLARFPDLECAQ